MKSEYRSLKTQFRKAYLKLFDAVFVPQVIEITQELDAFLADVNILVETFDEDPEGIGLESTILTTRASSLMGPQNCLLKTGLPRASTSL